MRNLTECPYIINVPVENRPVETVIVLIRQGQRQLNGNDVDRYEFSIPDDERVGNFIGYLGAHMAALRRSRRVRDCHLDRVLETPFRRYQLVNGHRQYGLVDAGSFLLLLYVSLRDSALLLRSVALLVRGPAGLDHGRTPPASED